MSVIRSASIVVAVCALGLASCKSESKSPYPQGYPQGYPMQQQGMQQQPMQQGMQQQPMQQQPMQQQPAQQQPAQQQNPLAGLAALGQAMGQMGGQQPAQQPAAAPAVGGLVPWAELAKALPMSAPGWTAQGQPTGETASMLGIGASTARGKLVQGGMNAEIEILDNAMAAGMAGMGFAMMPTVDSSEQRSGRVSIGPYSGIQNFHKNEGKAEIIVIVGNRLMVTIKVGNTTSEQPAQQLAHLVNYQLLSGLIGG